MRKKLFAMFAALLSAMSAGAGDLTVSASGPLAVGCRNRPVVVADRFLISGEPVTIGLRRTEEIGGATVYNGFGEERGIAFRREAALRDGGREVEISFQAQVPAYSEAAFGQKEDGTPKDLVYEIVLPAELFRGSEYTIVTGRSKKTGEKTGKGIPHPGASIRYLELRNAGETLVFDCDPNGVNAHGDYGPNAVVGMWGFAHVGDQVILTLRYKPSLFGGDMTGKLVIRSGEEGGYDARHAHRAYSYFSLLEPERRYVFGAAKHGKSFTAAGTLPYSAARQFGWEEHGPLAVRNFAPEGAQYSAVAGDRPAVFRTSGLRSGLYLVTVTAGNGKGRAVGPFSLSCDGKTVADKLTLAPDSVTVVNFPVWIENGEARLRFGGSWQLSTVNFQLLQSSREDYTFRRGFWCSLKGPHPSVMRHSEHYAAEPKYSINISSYPLPEQGKEAAGPRKAWSEPALHAKFPSPAQDWRGQSVISSLGPGNYGTFNEFDTPELLERRFGELRKDGISILLLNGFLARHVYPAHLARVERVVGDIVRTGHAKGMKVLDHQDYSLLWNMDSGFRVLVENMPKLQQTIDGNLPARGFCPVNPAALDPYMEYIAKYVRNTGLDGVMIDEACFHGLAYCGCAACREAFHRETGWYLPVNELSKDLNSKDSELWRVWLRWRQKKVGDFFYRVKQTVSPDNPEFVVMGYSTHYGLISTFASLSHGAALPQQARTWDFIGTEIMSRNTYACYRATQALRKAKNQFRNSSDIPIFGLVYSSGFDWNVFYFGWALNNMNAQSTWEIRGIHCPEGMSNYRSFTADKGNMNIKTARPAADVALLFSGASIDSQLGPYPSELLGVSQILSKHHIQHEFLNEAGLRPEILKKFKVLCLNNAMALSDRSWQNVKNFVRDGGTLLITGRTGMADEFGGLRKAFLPADFFPGLKLGGNNMRSAEFADAKQTWRLSEPLVGAQFIWPKNRVPAGCEVLMTAQLPTRQYPALVKTSFGKGTVHLTPYLFGIPLYMREVSPPKPFAFVPKPEAEALCFAVLKAAGVARNVWNPVNIPEAVLTSVYRDGDDTMVHFLNATGSRFKAGEAVPHVLTGDPYPEPAEDLIFEMPGRYGKIWAASPDFAERKALTGVFREGVTRVTLPKKLLRTYTIVHLLP